jgi:hypothetical protein
LAELLVGRYLDSAGLQGNGSRTTFVATGVDVDRIAISIVTELPEFISI